jgi:hypothetical protein
MLHIILFIVIYDRYEKSSNIVHIYILLSPSFLNLIKYYFFYFVKMNSVNMYTLSVKRGSFILINEL